MTRVLAMAVALALTACTGMPPAPQKAKMVCVEGGCPPPSLPPGVVHTPDAYLR